MYSGQIETRLEDSIDTDKYDVRVFANPNWFEVYVSWEATLGSEEDPEEPDLEDELANIVREETHWANADLDRTHPEYTVEGNDVVYMVKQNSGGELLGDTGDPLGDKLG